jgi:peptide/nickel transport system substrate-binding protein
MNESRHSMMQHDANRIPIDRLFDETISRRDVLKRALLGTGVLLSGAALLAACGDDDTEDIVDPGAADDVAEMTEDDDDSEDDADIDDRRGGILRVGLGGSAENFDPHHQTTFESIWANGMMYSRVVRINADMEIEPDLATSWETSDDGLEWYFELRDGVLFHNGREFVAEDVVHSIKRVQDPDEGTAFASQIEMVDDLEAVSDTELTIYLSAPYADLLSVLGFYAFRIIPIEEADSLSTDPVGTGPYKLRSHSPDERTVLERFEDYFNIDEEAFVDEIHYIKIDEETARLTALTGGTIDFVNEISPPAIPMVEDAPGIVFEEVATGSYHTIIMTATEPPFDDVRVRQAFKAVMNRGQVVQAVLQGYGVEAADQPVPPVDPMYGEIPIPERDVERARELLAEAGYPDGIDIELHTTAGRVGLQECALTFQELASEAGIRVEVTNHPVDAYWADVWMQRPFNMSNWGQRPNADLTLSVAYLDGAPWNESRWVNERFEELVRSARETLDEDERREMYREAQQILSEDGAVGIPYFMSVMGAWSERMHGYQMNPMRQVDLHRVWLEEE